MGFQDFGDFGHHRHPAIRTTGLLTLALAGLSPAEHTSVTGRNNRAGHSRVIRLPSGKRTGHAKLPMHEEVRGPPQQLL
jgi:hypothetical protein